ncbi:MAG TPA: serine/threonine-protein kinase [Pyrinomonadaceae bacterium]
MKVCSVCCRCYDDRAVHCAESSHQAPLGARDGDIEMISGYRFESLRYSDAREDIFDARHMASDRSCIIRLIRALGDRVKDFLRDAEIASSLFHPNIVDTYETGQLDQGELFVVTEDAAGRNLRAMMANGPPDLMTAIRIATEAASAIHTMHLKSLVHRAVRPENIIVTRDENGELLVRVKGPDLGGLIECSIVSDKFTIDSARDRLRYFAPEQCNGESVGIKTDVYSLGIVLYEMLAGRPPFDSPKASGLIEMHRHRRPAEISIDDFELRMLVTHTVMQSLSKHPSDRQSSANAFARQLRHVEQLSTHVSTPPPAGVVPPEPLRSSPRIHISDAGQAADIGLAALVSERILTGMTDSLPTTKAKTGPALEHVIHELPMPDIIVEKAPSIRQRLSRLRLDRRPPQNVSVAAQPVKVFRDLEDDLPSMEAVRAARSEMSDPIDAGVQQPSPKAAPPQQVEAPRPAPARVAAAAASAGAGVSAMLATSHHAPDEITAPPSRGNPIRIDISVSKPTPKRSPVRHIVPSPADETPSFPTLFSSETSAMVEGRAGASLLSSFYGSEEVRLGWPVQKVTLAAGVVAAAAAIFIVGSLSVSRYVSTASADQRSEVVSTPNSDSRQVPATDSLPSVHKKPLKYFDVPKPKSDSTSASRSKPDETRSTAAKDQPPNASKTEKKAATRADNARRDKTSAKPETAKRGKTDRSIATASNKPTATTRPRIVKVPRQ